MNNIFKLSKKEVVVVFATLFFLFMNLGAVSNKSHVHAKRIICKSNLEQCYQVMIAFTNDNNGKFPDADHNDDGSSDTHGQWWIQPFKQYAENDDILICSVANQHPEDEPESTFPLPGRPSPIEYECWGTRNLSTGEWTWGSYGFNGWLMDPDTGTWGAPNQDGFWGKPESITNLSAVPLFLDSRYYDAWPNDTDIPDSQEFGGYDGYGYMRLFLQNRHGNGVSMGVFTDGSARTVGLKELWTLKWHKTFDTNNPYTQPSAPWPTWMQGFKDY